MKSLAVDAGGTHLKILASGRQDKREFASGPGLAATRMVEQVEALARDWGCDRVGVGYPGPVVHGRPAAEPQPLGKGWLGFDFAKAFGRPTRVFNDAAMQALGSDRGGFMLFLGFGTGLGTAFGIDGIVEPLEPGHLPYRKATCEDYDGLRGLQRHGRKKWRRHLAKVVERLAAAMEPDEIVLGGGHAALLKELPPRCRLGDNANAFLGRFRAWDAQGSRRSTSAERSQAAARKTPASRAPRRRAAASAASRAAAANTKKEA
jgi:polyphosphate glucokinase